MKSLKEKLAMGGLVTIGVILILALCYGISWIATCGIIYLITLCFSLNFSWGIATGIWLIMILLKSIFTITVKNKE